MTQPSPEALRRKAQPLFSGVLAYFPDALLAVAELSRVGNEQHNPGKPLHWDRTKSTDEPDALARHLLQRGTVDTDGVKHSTKCAWRALAMLQKEIEAERSTRAADLKAIAAFENHPSRVDPTAQRPDENAAQHRARVNTPWPAPAQPAPDPDLARVVANSRYARQPDDFADLGDFDRWSRR